MKKTVLLFISLTGLVHAESLANTPIKLGEPMQGGFVACLKGEKNNLIVSKNFKKNFSYDDAAKKCQNHQVDDKGNSPCKPGNTCFKEWFLPSLDQLRCIYDNQYLIKDEFEPCVHWSSTDQKVINFETGHQGFAPNKAAVRCVRELQSHI